MPDARASSRTHIGPGLPAKLGWGGVLPARAAVPRRRPRERVVVVGPGRALDRSGLRMRLFTAPKLWSSLRSIGILRRTIVRFSAVTPSRLCVMQKWLGFLATRPRRRYFESPRHGPNAFAVRRCQQDLGSQRPLLRDRRRAYPLLQDGPVRRADHELCRHQSHTLPNELGSAYVPATYATLH